MNAIIFGVKKAYHGCLRVMRKPLLSLELTSARGDMLSALLRRKQDFRWVPQRYLGEVLHVSAPVVSRMLRSLEELGWVVRERCPVDRRQKWVALTDKGREIIENAHKTLKRPAMRLMSEAVSVGRGRDPFLNLCDFESYLLCIRREFFDTSSILYPWHPDD
jgi:DNA-binding MarR family transcriptional regulator